MKLKRGFLENNLICIFNVTTVITVITIITKKINKSEVFIRFALCSC